MNVRLRTGYSFRAAVGKLDKVMARLVECQYPAAPITDRSSTFGYVKWQKLCQKNNLKPVFGVELAVTSDLSDRKARMDFWTFIAINSTVPINKLVELATKQFYYRPQLTYQQAIEATGLVKVIGHRSDLTKFNPSPEIYVGLAPSVNRGYINQALSLGHQLVAAGDNRWPSPEKDDKILYETIVGRDASLQSYDQHIQSEEEWKASTQYFVDDINQQRAITNAHLILRYANVTLRKSSLLVPEKPLTLRQMCEEGAKKLGCDLTQPIYLARLDRELNLIADKKYEDYFYVIADLCQWSRANMLVGPARGSSCGSLVCYLLEITTIDPIPYGLIFERFVDIHREDMPDIDIDFSDKNREKAIAYLSNKYGSERVARIGSVALYKGPSALKEAGAALRVPRFMCEAVADSALKRSSGDARAMDTLEDTLTMMPAGQEMIREYPEMRVVTRMEGHPRHSSQHAAGVVISNEPTINYIALDAHTGAMQCDKKDAEELNLLKIDCLGLTQLSTFEYALELAGLERLTLESIPKDDPLAFKVLNDKKFCGIFQFNGIALQTTVNQFTVETIDDVIITTALARPGPLASGAQNDWTSRRNGAKPVTYPHPVFEPYLKSTLGIVVYQEQVMEIGRNIGGLSWEDTTNLRKAMSKSLGIEYFNQFGEKFKNHARQYISDQKQLDKVWQDLCSMGSWAFNLAHAVAYGTISYMCCWLKAHHTEEFAAATLTNEGDPAKQIQILRELVNEGIPYVPVDAARSTDRWTVGIIDEKKTLIGPFTNIKGIGPKTIEKIIAARNAGGAMPKQVERLISESENRLSTLFPIREAFARLLPDPLKIGVAASPTPINKIIVTDKDYSVTLFCTLTKINPRDENETIKVSKRGGRIIEGEPTTSLNLYLTDDTDTVFAKISRFDYDVLAKPIVDRGKAGKCLYIIQGKVKGGKDKSFRMVSVEHVIYVGDIAVAKPKAKEKVQENKEEQLKFF